MNRLAKVFGLLLVITVLMAGTSYWLAEESEAPLTILFTHDLHDNLLPYNVEKEGRIEDYGGFARLQTAIKQQRAKI